MHPKRKAREFALQVLFIWDSNGSADTDLGERTIRGASLVEGVVPGAVVVVAPAVQEAAGGAGGVGGTDTRSDGGWADGVDVEAKVDAMDMARGTWLARDTIDKRLEFHAPQWPPRRQPGVDRAILRLAVWELGEGKTPVKVVLDEAIELAKLFSTENSPAFVNGVLDAILRENQALMSGAPVTGGTVTATLDIKPITPL